MSGNPHTGPEVSNNVNRALMQMFGYVPEGPDSNEEARQMALSMIPNITNKVIRQANKVDAPAARFYELPPMVGEIE